MEAEIISIGTELLLGEILDTNTRHISLVLRENGVDLYRTITVGDNVERIGDAVRTSMSRAPIVITTGGLGPTVDDATREGIARAADLDLVFSEELWEEIQDRFASFRRSPTENKKRQAYLPSGAIPIKNPVGTAPGFILESAASCVISLPGVPAEMEYLLNSDVVPYLRKRFNLGELIKSRKIRTSGIGESTLSSKIRDLEEMSNPTVGFSAHPGHVDIRVTAKARTELEADEMIWKVEATIQQRLGRAIYGFDDDTLEAVTLEMLQQRNWKLVTVEYGTAGELGGALSINDGVLKEASLLEEMDDPTGMTLQLREVMVEQKAETGLSLYIGELESAPLYRINLITPDEELDISRSLPSGYPYARQAAVNIAINTLRRSLIKNAR